MKAQNVLVLQLSMQSWTEKKNTVCFLASAIQGPWIINPPPTAGCVQSDFNMLPCLYTRHYPSLHCLMCVCGTEPRSCRQKQHDTFLCGGRNLPAATSFTCQRVVFWMIFPLGRVMGRVLFPADGWVLLICAIRVITRAAAMQRHLALPLVAFNHQGRSTLDCSGWLQARWIVPE